MFMVATSVGLWLGSRIAINIKGIFVALNVISIWCVSPGKVLYPGVVVLVGWLDCGECSCFMFLIQSKQIQLKLGWL